MSIRAPGGYSQKVMVSFGVTVVSTCWVHLEKVSYFVQSSWKGAPPMQVLSVLPSAAQDSLQVGVAERIESLCCCVRSQPGEMQ